MINEQLVLAKNQFRTVRNYNNWLMCLEKLYPEDKERFYSEVKEFRREVKANITDNNYKLLKRSYLLTAKDSFDDYMIYLEWDRDPDKRFWLPRRKVLLPVCKDIEALVNGDLDILTISMPPGAGKTTFKNYFYSWIMGKYPDRPNLDSGHSDMMIASSYEGVLEIINDPVEYLWRDVFGNLQVFTNAKEHTIDIGKKHRFSTLTCRPINGSLTGATRCELMLSADDLVSGIEEALSKERLDKKFMTYTNDLKTRKKGCCRELHIATRWSVHDVIGRLERENANNPRAKFVVIPALDENGHSNFNYDYGVGFDDKYFHEMKEAMDEVSFKALYQNQPVEREGLVYFPDDLRRYYDLPEGDPDAIYSVVDVADNGSDDTVMPVFAVYGNDHYMIDCVCSNALPEVTNGLIADMLLKYKVMKCQFESNSMGFRAADEVADIIKSKLGRTHITKKRTTANKETKIIANAGWVKEHCLFKDNRVIQRGSPYYWFMEKMCSYTQFGRNKHDDVPDALAQYVLFCDNLSAGTVTVVKRVF